MEHAKKQRRGRFVAGVMCVAALLGAAGCERQSGSVQTLAGSDIVRPHDAQKIAQGEGVYRAYCARCHGERGEGAPNWRQPDAQGFYPPPPLDGSGHAWHHSTAWLKDMIRYGSPPGQGRMPAWGATLSEAQIDAVIAYFQSLWPDEVYAAWYDMTQRASGAPQ